MFQGGEEARRWISTCLLVELKQIKNILSTCMQVKLLAKQRVNLRAFKQGSLDNESFIIVHIWCLHCGVAVQHQISRFCHDNPDKRRKEEIK